MTSRAPKTVHLRHLPALNTSWCGRVITRMWMTDDPDAATCHLCLRAWEKADGQLQLVLL